jgi:hypothetical protein
VYEYLPESREWSDYMLRLINECQHGGADFNECDRTFKRMRVGNLQDWQREWLRTAEKVERQGDEALAKGRLATAKSAFLRAYTYYRTAEYYMERDERRVPIYRRGIDCFAKGGKLFSPPLERVEIPYEGMTLAAHFYPAHRPQSGGPTPAVVFLPGADSTKEELLFQGGLDLLERGIGVPDARRTGPGRGPALPPSADPIGFRETGRGRDRLPSHPVRSRCRPGRSGRHQHGWLLRRAGGGVRATG